MHAAEATKYVVGQIVNLELKSGEFSGLMEIGGYSLVVGGYVDPNGVVKIGTMYCLCQ